MSDHATQAQRIFDLLQRHEGRWVPLPQILQLFIANYRARITELRRAGHCIELRDEHVGGQRRTAYRLVTPLAVTLELEFPDEARP